VCGECARAHVFLCVCGECMCVVWCGVNIKFVHILVYNKRLLFNMDDMNKKVKDSSCLNNP